MNPIAMQPFGSALLAYLDGDTESGIIVRRDDGKEGFIPTALFFRGEPDFTELERIGIERCRGHVLDIGAGAGSQSAALQRRGHPVTAIDISPEAVTVARRRGVADVRCADVMSFQGGPFDTLLMLGHGIGMVETIEGLRHFLSRAHPLLSPGGQVFLDSLDVRVTDDLENLAYQQANAKAGRYIGEIRMQFEFRGEKGPFFGWLHVDAESLQEHSASAGWRCQILHHGAGGDYLASLTKRKDT